MTFEDMKKIVVDTLNCEEEKVTMEASLTEDLEADSLDAVELNMALELYQGTLIFVSHDREFVSSLATRILEITPERVIDFSGNYEDYLRSKGIDG